MKYKSARKTFEYLAAGKPIIVSNVVGREGFLIEGKNCITYEPENPKDLAEKIKKLLNNNELKKQMQNNNTKLAKKYSWKRNIERSGLVIYLQNILRETIQSGEDKF